MNHIDLMEGLNIDQNCTVTRQETRASLGFLMLNYKVFANFD
jgi:hypothetical protein